VQPVHSSGNNEINSTVTAGVWCDCTVAMWPGQLLDKAVRKVQPHIFSQNTQ